MRYQKKATPWCFLLPSILGIVVFFLIPFFRSFGYAVTDRHGMFVGLDKLDYQNLTAAAFLIVLLITLLILGFFLLDRRTDLKEG